MNFVQKTEIWKSQFSLSQKETNNFKIEPARFSKKETGPDFLCAEENASYARLYDVWLTEIAFWVRFYIMDLLETACWVRFYIMDLLKTAFRVRLAQANGAFFCVQTVKPRELFTRSVDKFVFDQKLPKKKRTQNAISSLTAQKNEPRMHFYHTFSQLSVCLACREELVSDTMLIL